MLTVADQLRTRQAYYHGKKSQGEIARELGRLGWVWIKSRTYEIAQVSRVGWEVLFVELAAVPGKDKKLDGGAKGPDTAGKAA